MSAYSTQVSGRASCIRYWSQDDTSGTAMVDAKGSGNGTYPGSGVTLNQTPLISGDTGKSTLWAGTNPATCTTFSPGAAWTIEAIIRATALAGSQTIVGNGDGGAELYVLADGKLSWYNGSDHASTGAVTEDVTVHIAATNTSGNVLTFYINGVAAGTVTGSAAVNFSKIAGNLFGENFVGFLDELSINNAALSAGDIESDYDLYIAGEGGDVTAPSLTSASGTETGTTTADLAVTTDEANGTLYTVVTTSSSTPSAAQVKAGQDHASAAAAFDDSQSISSTGAKTFNASGLSPNTEYWAYFMHEDAATNQSTVASSSSFTTDATDVTAPTLQTCVANGASVVLTYNEALDDASEPANDDFSFSNGKTVTGVAIASSTVTLTVTPAYTNGAAGGTLDYTADADPIQDVAGNDAANLNDQAVTNNTPDTTAPATPTGGAADNGYLRNVLTWTDPADADLVSVKIYSSTTSGSGFTLLATVDAGEETYADTGLTAGTTYYYKLSAVDEVPNESAQSSEFSATPKDTITYTYDDRGAGGTFDPVSPIELEEGVDETAEIDYTNPTPGTYPVDIYNDAGFLPNPQTIDFEVEPNGALTGTAVTGFTATATLTANGAVTGTSTTTFTAVGTISGQGLLVGASTIAFTAVGSFASPGDLTATAVIGFTTSGVLNATGALSGNSTLTFTTSGILNAAGALSGNSTLLFTTSSVLNAAGALNGSNTLLFTTSGVLSATGALNGSNTLTFTTSGLLGSNSITGTVTFTFAVSGALLGLGAPLPPTGLRRIFGVVWYKYPNAAVYEVYDEEGLFIASSNVAGVVCTISGTDRVSVYAKAANGKILARGGFMLSNKPQTVRVRWIPA